MKVYFHGWFGGFFDKTNPGLHVGFFLQLFERVYAEACEIGALDESEVLCECVMLFSEGNVRRDETYLKRKKWKHTYMMSGEQYSNKYQDEYDCVLWMRRNHANVVNMPLHVPYIYANDFLDALESAGRTCRRTSAPKHDVLVFVSNPNGQVRNRFLDELDKHFAVCYAGRYKNNTGGLLPVDYNSPQFTHLVSQYKFIVSMENMSYETGVTEKIVHGMLAHTVPVYWGSPRVHEYFNEKRFLWLKEDAPADVSRVIGEMKRLKADEAAWLEMVNQDVFPTQYGDTNPATAGKMWRTMDEVARDVRCLLKINASCWNHITRVYTVLNKKYEADRLQSMQALFESQNVSEAFVKYNGPTYAYEMTPEMYNYHITVQHVLKMRRYGPPMKKGEISLILNLKSTMEDIVKNYSDGIFFIFESDAIKSKDIHLLNDILDEISGKDWDCIHLGGYEDCIFELPTSPWITGYRDFKDPWPPQLRGYLQRNVTKERPFVEDMKSDGDKFRFFRKFHTRCCDCMLWRYKSIVMYLEYLNRQIRNYGAPNDYVMIEFLEKNLDFKHYWSLNECFVQGSNLKLMERNWDY